MMDVRLENFPPEAAPPTSSNNGFPIIAIAVIGIIATILILISYYIFVSSCCFRLKHLLNPSSSLQRFSFRGTRHNQELLFMCSRRGLDERMIHNIPTFQYCKTEEEGEEDKNSNSSLFKCVVCLNEFQDHDLLRLLPNCNHAFHIDCIDVWLQNNVNCPLCRASLIGVIGGPRDPNIAPNSSPQHQQPIIISRRLGSDEHFVMVHVTTREDTDSFRIGASDSNRHILGGQSSTRSEYKVSGKLTPKKKIRHVSVMGDECINVREEDEQFSVKPIRRSFSMDSAADHHVYLSVQEEILRHNRRLSEIRSNGESSRRSQRSMFSFGCGRGSENALLPLDQS